MHNNHPIGTIIMFPSLNFPKSYLLCDGSLFDKASFRELEQILNGNRLPNFINRFPRGVGPVNNDTVLKYQNWATGAPRNRFITVSKPSDQQQTDV